jgi:hypothetical protein
MRITALDGTIEQAQILVYDSPARVKLVLDDTSVSLVRPVSLQYRAGICSPAFPGGTPVPAGKAIPLAAFPAGRWIWCGGGGIPSFGYGFDLNGDGAAFALDIDRQATSSRASTVASSRSGPRLRTDTPIRRASARVPRRSQSSTRRRTPPLEASTSPFRRSDAVKGACASRHEPRMPYYELTNRSRRSVYPFLESCPPHSRFGT